MSQKKTTAPAPVQEQLPTQLDVKIYRPSARGPVLADASVNINGCFAVRGVRVMEGKNGPFVSMPSRQVKGEYKDICFPCTKEFKQEFDKSVIDAYRQELRQSMEQAQSQESHEYAGPDMGGMGMG